MKTKYRQLMAVLVALIALITSTSYASTVLPQLDQSHVVDTTGTYSAYRVSSTRSYSQTFEVGLSGYLSMISIQLGGSADNLAPTRISIVGTVGENKLPNSNNILWTSNEFSNLGLNLDEDGWVNITVNVGSPYLIDNQTYGIILTTTDPVSGNPDIRWLGSSTPSYQGGGFFENTGSGWSAISNIDAGFKTTMIPEPSNFLTIFSSLGMLVPLRKR